MSVFRNGWRDISNMDVNICSLIIYVISIAELTNRARQTLTENNGHRRDCLYDWRGNTKAHASMSRAWLYMVTEWTMRVFFFQHRFSFIRVDGRTVINSSFLPPFLFDILLALMFRDIPQVPFLHLNSKLLFGICVLIIIFTWPNHCNRFFF
jgi:hypothetical protein